MFQKKVESDARSAQSRRLGDLIEQYVQKVYDRNKRMVDVIRVKEEIERKIEQNVNEKEVQAMRDELHTLIGDYEALVNDKIAVFQDMIANLREISKNNDAVVKNEEEIARLRNNVEIVARDIAQKKRMLSD